MSWGYGKVRPKRSYLRVARQLGQVAEKKVYESGQAQTVVRVTNNTASQTHLYKPYVPARGTRSQDRIGDKIFVRYVTFKAVFCPTNSIVPSIPNLRLLWLKSKNESQQTTTIPQTGLPIYITTDPDRKFFTTLSDTRLNLFTPDGNENNSKPYVRYYYKRLKIFKTMTLDGDNLESNGYPSLPFLYIMPFQGSNPGTTEHNTNLLYQWRITFTDS